MSTVRLYGDAARGIMLRDWTIFKSYRMQFFGQIAALFMGLALFYFLSHLITISKFGSHAEYFAYVVLGMIMVQVLQSTMQVATGLRGELVAGTFERILLSPFGGVAGTLSMMIVPFCMSFVSALLTLALGVFVFGLKIHWETAALAVPVALLGTGAFTAFGLLFACSAIVFKQVVGGAGLMMSGIALVSGLYFPIALLPAWLKWFSNVQPFTPTVELLRHLLVGTPLTNSVVGDLAKIVGFVIVFLPLSVLALSKSVRLGQRRGTIIEY
jgi:ABC-type polysaccharide/polyol phosphate export permease